MFSNVYFFKDFLCEIKFQGILAVGFKKYGSYEELNRSPIKHLLEVIFHRKSALYKHTELNFKIFWKVYVKANQDESLRSEALNYFARMEQSI